jgi:hypothetical protein
VNEIWTMGVTQDGKYVLTASHDKSMRLWEKTNEPLVLDDERETVKNDLTLKHKKNAQKMRKYLFLKIRKKKNNMKTKCQKKSK